MLQKKKKRIFPYRRNTLVVFAYERISTVLTLIYSVLTMIDAVTHVPPWKIALLLNKIPIVFTKNPCKLKKLDVAQV